MKLKQKIKIMVDIIMTILLLFLMAYNYTGQEIHEWLGVGILIFFTIHNILNYMWYKTLLKGKYNASRALTLLINFSILFTVILLMISGMSMSDHVFTFLTIKLPASLARKIHLSASYWGFALMSIHLGMHWSMMMNMMKKMFNVTSKNTYRQVITKVITMILIVMGIFLIGKHDLLSYMFLTTEFVFFDDTQSMFVYCIENFLILSTYASLGYYLSKYIRKSNKRKGVDKK